MTYAEPAALLGRPDVDGSLAATAIEDEALTCLFRGLADPTRLAILAELAAGERTVVELTQHVGLAQSTVSKHLACLRGCGLVDSRPVGRSSVSRLRRPELVGAVLAAARELAEATGGAVAACPTYGRGAR